MKDSLRNVKKDLRAFAKRCKGFTYTDSALIAFLITGVISISVNIFSAQEAKTIENQRQVISTSIKDIHHQVQETRRENDKLLKKTNLELIQLMEQGDHVVKSPWSSWQYGVNGFFNDWNGTYKGRGDKKAKYPYEGVYERGGLYERAVNPTSSKYSLLGKSSRVNSSLNSSRTGLDSDSYGLVGVRPLLEPTVGFNVSVAIRPKQVVKGAITIADKTPVTPATPEAIEFKAPEISIKAPDAPSVNPAPVTITGLTINGPTLPSLTLPTPLSFSPATPTVNISITPPSAPAPVSAPGTGNGPESYLLGKDGAGNWKWEAGQSPYASSPAYAPSGRAQVAIASEINVNTLTSGGRARIDYNANISGGTVTFSNAQLTSSADTNGYTGWPYNATSYTLNGVNSFALIKNTGNANIQINDTDIDFTGIGGTTANNQRWLFHTDAHSDSAESAWTIGNSTKINMSGTNLKMYTSQFHAGNHNLLFTNNGKIDASGNNNVVWLALNERASNNYRTQKFTNNGSVSLAGINSTFAYIDMPTTKGYDTKYGTSVGVPGIEASNGNGDTDANSNGWVIENTKKLDISGTGNTGIFVNDNFKYWAAQITLNPSTVTLGGTGNAGVYFKGWADLDGGAVLNGEASGNGTSSASTFNMEVSGSGNAGLYFNYSKDDSSTTKDTFKLTGTSTMEAGGNGNILIYNGNGDIDVSNAFNLITNGSNNVAIYNASADKFVTKATISGTGTEAVGIYSTGTGETTNTGNVTLTANKVKGVVSNGSGVVINNNGGTIKVEGDEVAGAIAMNSGVVNIGKTTGPSNIEAKGKSGLGVYATSIGEVNIGDSTIKSENGAVNVYSNGGDINLGVNGKTTTVQVGANSLGFMQTGSKKVNFVGTTNANIEENGTAFYIAPSSIPSTVSYPSSIASLSSGYTGWTNLTLKMGKNSNVVVASYVDTKLSNLDLTTVGIPATQIVDNSGGAGYKDFLLYKSKLTIDSPKTYADYKKISLSSSSIINDTTISSNDDEVKLMAQENDDTNAANKWVKLENNKTIELNGKNSVAMYASDGTIKNNAGAKITMGGKNSVAIYGKNTGKGDTDITNAGEINIGESSVGLLAEDYTKTGLENANKIIINGNGGIGMYYKAGTLDNSVTSVDVKNTGTIVDNSTVATPSSNKQRVGIYVENNTNASKTVKGINTGTIKLLGDGATSSSEGSIGIYTNATAKDSNPLENTGTIELGKFGIGMFGYEQKNTGDITVGDNGVAIYSQGGDVEITGSKTIKVGKDARAVIATGNGQKVESTGFNYVIGDNSFGFVNRNTGSTGNTFKISGGSATLNNNGFFIYSVDTKGTVTNSTDITMDSKATTGQNYGIYSIGTVTNSGDITLTKGKGNVGIYSTEGGDITNSGNISLGESDISGTVKKYSIGIISKTGKVTNTGAVNIGSTSIDGKDGIGLFADTANSKDGEIINKGAVTVFGDNTVGAYANQTSKISLGTGGDITIKGKKTTGYYVDAGTGNDIASGVSITVTGDNANGVFVNKGGLTYKGDTKVTGDGAYGFVAGKNSVIVADGGSVTVAGSSGSSKVTTGTDGRGTAGVVVLQNASLTGGKLDVTADVSGDKSVGIYSDGNLVINKADVKAYDGAVNFFADKDNGVISIGNNNGTSTAVAGTGTDKGSLLFYTPGAGKILINKPMTATVEGGINAATRATAFYYTGSGTPGSYTQLTPANVAAWARSSYGNGTSTLGNLTLNMQPDSRLFLTQNVDMKLSNTSITNLFSSLTTVEKPNISGTGYRRFMLYKSHLEVDKPVDLDNANDDYRQLEISNSSITNNNTITGTQAGQIAMAQENTDTNKNIVTLTNNGTINLSGAGSAAIYGKNAIVKNSSTGTITLGDTSTGLYGLNNTEISNDGKITAGNKSTGIFYSDIYVNPATKAETVYNTTTGLSNNGTITLTGDEGVGITYEPGNVTGSVRFENTGTITSATDKNVGMYAKTARNNGAYETENKGTITLGNSASLNDPNVGMYTNATNAATNPLINSGTITVGKNAVGVYGFKETNSGNINAGDGAVAMYSKGGNVDLTGGTINVGKNEAVAVYTVGNGQKISNTGTSLNIGDTSFGFVNVGTGNTIESKVGNVNLNNDSVYVYSNDNAGVIRNSTNITSIGTSGNNYGIYAAGSIENSGNIDFNSGIGNVGVYTVNGGNAKNSGIISVGASDPANQVYSVGMAAGYIGDSKIAASTGTIENNGQINVNGKYSIGMYGVGNGTTVTNNNNIVLNADNTIGVYVEEGAKAVNNGIIRTGASGLSNVTGVVLGRNSTLENNNTINIDSASGAGVYLKGGTIINRGNVHVSGVGSNEVYEMNSDPTTKRMGDVTIDAPAGSPTAKIIVRGKGEVQPVLITTTAENPVTVSASSIGLYVDTSSKNYTKSIDNLGALTSEADLIFGVEAAQGTTSRYIKINDKKMLDPYNNAILYGGVSKWTVYSGSLTWVATPTLDQNTGEVTSVYMAKSSYTNWATDSKVTPTKVTDTYNFADGLEQRYGVEALGTRENQLFQKLNSIGNNEEILLYQAFDEMMGHQYGNTQLRINATGNLLDKEFKYLKHDWRNPSKQNNKIKAFGIRDEYKTDTAGIIDYTSNAYGVAYVHEDEKVKMGNSSGWYAGAVTNRFKFKDIGHSREDQTMVKLGIFKTMSPKKDYNGSLQWTIGGDVFAGVNNMKRKFLVVDDVFEAKSNYNSYGAALKTDLGYDIRMSERTHLRPYGGLKMEYGRFNNIKEDSGQMRLEVKGNDYFSVKPEAGVEFKYVQPLAVRTNLTVGLTAAYENELGKVGDVKNEGRVRYTTADWFGIRGEKEDRRGNGKFDLNIGVDNTRFGVTVNAGYDTKGSNIRGGIGFRAIY